MYMHVYIANSPINVHRNSQTIHITFVFSVGFLLNIVDLWMPIELCLYSFY